ncbi:hypothetical protein BH09PSE1_BH09PSE1_26940 [soil metagenome]
MIVAIVLAFVVTVAQQTAPAPAVPAPSAPSAPSAPATSSTTATPSESEQICRRQRIEGSRQNERVCHTRAEWDAIRQNARSNRDEASRNQRGY